MSLLMNILWLVLGGVVTAVEYIVGSVAMMVTIIGIPFGIQCFKIAGLSLVPFGKKVGLHFGKHPVINTIWLLLCGWWLALSFLVVGIMQCITIIGIPGGIQCFKIMKIAFFPFGAKIF